MKRRKINKKVTWCECCSRHSDKGFKISLFRTRWGQEEKHDKKVCPFCAEGLAKSGVSDEVMIERPLWFALIDGGIIHRGEGEITMESPFYSDLLKLKGGSYGSLNRAIDNYNFEAANNTKEA